MSAAVVDLADERAWRRLGAGTVEVRWYVLVDAPGRERFWLGAYGDDQAARLVALECGRQLREAGVTVAALCRTDAAMRGERVVSPVYAADVLARLREAT